MPPRERGSYQGYLSACIVAGTTFGPVAGGFITQLWGCHAVFLAYPALGAVAIVLLLRVPAGAHSNRRAAFDAAGMLLLTCFIVPLLLAASQLQRLNPAMLPRLALTVALAGAGLATLLWQQARTRSPLLALRLQRHPAFWRSDIMAACSGPPSSR